MAAWRKTDVDPVVLETTPEPDPAFRNEVDPDPLIEEMVGRLRDGLSSLVAVDEWGRPLAWRNVVRLALGPLASRLRDTEQALELAVSMIPPTAEEPAEHGIETAAPAAVETPAAVEAPAVVEAPAAVDAPDPAAAAAPVAAPAAVAALAESLADEGPLAQPAPEPVAAEAPVVDPDAPEQPVTGATVDVILPAADAVSDVPIAPEAHTSAPMTLAAPETSPSAVPVLRPAGATSLFTVSGDQRSVPVSPLGSGELLGGSSADDSTSAKYDRFLTSLYGQGQQVRRD